MKPTKEITKDANKLRRPERTSEHLQPSEHAQPFQSTQAAEPPIDTNSGEPIDTVQLVTMVVRNACVGDPTLGTETVYTGPPADILHGVSSLRTPDGGTLNLLAGTPVRVCTRPTIPFGSTEPSVRVHFSRLAKGHTSDCRCGACGCVYSLTKMTPEPCSCGTEVYDEGKQQCVVM